MQLSPTRLLAISAGFTLLCLAPAAHADEWAVYESDAGAEEQEEEEGSLDEELEAQDFDVGGSTGPSKGPAKGPSSGPSKGAACNCDVPGGGNAPLGLAGVGLLGAVCLVARSRRAQRGGRA